MKEFTSVTLEDGDETHSDELASHENHGAAGGHDHHDGPGETRFSPAVYDMLENVFKLKKRNTTIELEVLTGVIQFISCLYVLPVVPFQMQRAHFNSTDSIMATTVTCAIGCIISAFLTDMPFIIAPPTSVSIFYAVSLQQSGLGPKYGNGALMVAGAALALCGIVPPLGRFFTRMIPDPMQASISVGIGLITALAGATEINLVIRGKYTILDMGPITPEVVVAIANLIIVAACLHYHVKGAFCIGLLFGTVVWWIIADEFPKSLALQPDTNNDSGLLDSKHSILMVMNLFILFLITLNGLSRSLSDLAQLTKPSGAIPRGNMLFIVCGLVTILSGYFSGPPILISPETAAGIKAGARTGLSTLVCGLLFGIATFFSPLFAAVPAAGTAPLLIMVGVMMYGNGKRVDWADYKISVPAYCVLFFIPFTYSILRGVAIGYVVYVILGLFTGEMITNSIACYHYYKDPAVVMKYVKDEFQGKKKGAMSDAENEDEENVHDYKTHESYKNKSTFQRIGLFLDTMEMNNENSGVTKLDHM
eukprot:gene14832-19929_t